MGKLRKYLKAIIEKEFDPGEMIKTFTDPKFIANIEISKKEPCGQFDKACKVIDDMTRCRLLAEDTAEELKEAIDNCRYIHCSTVCRGCDNDDPNPYNDHERLWHFHNLGM